MITDLDTITFKLIEDFDTIIKKFIFVVYRPEMAGVSVVSVERHLARDYCNGYCNVLDCFLETIWSVEVRPGIMIKY